MVCQSCGKRNFNKNQILSHKAKVCNTNFFTVQISTTNVVFWPNRKENRHFIFNHLPLVSSKDTFLCRVSVLNKIANYFVHCWPANSVHFTKNLDSDATS